MAVTSLQAILAAETLKDCIAAFRAALLPYGIDTFSAGEIDTARRNRAVFAGMHWPEEWRRFYFASGLLERDPLVENLGRYGGPFTWAELRADRRLAIVGTEALDRIAEAGWRDGLVVPLIRTETHFGIVSIVAREPIAPEQKLELVPLCLAFHAAVLPLARRDGFDVPPAGLTPREIECIALVARGKADPQIAETLGISAATAHEHVERAKRRLETHTRAELAAAAIALGIIAV